MDIKKPKEFKLKIPNCVYIVPGIYASETDESGISKIHLSLSQFLDALKIDIDYIKDLMGDYETE